MVLYRKIIRYFTPRRPLLIKSLNTLHQIRFFLINSAVRSVTRFYSTTISNVWRALPYPLYVCLLTMRQKYWYKDDCSPYLYSDKLLLFYTITWTIAKL